LAEIRSAFSKTIAPFLYRVGYKGLKSGSPFVRELSRKILPKVVTEAISKQENTIGRGVTEERIVDVFKSEMKSIYKGREIRAFGEGLVSFDKLRRFFNIFNIIGEYSIGDETFGSVRGIAISKGGGVGGGMESVTLRKEFTKGNSKVSRFVDVAKTAGVIEGDMLVYEQVGGTLKGTRTPLPRQPIKPKLQLQKARSLAKELLKSGKLRRISYESVDKISSKYPRAIGYAQHFFNEAGEINSVIGIEKRISLFNLLAKSKYGVTREQVLAHELEHVRFPYASEKEVCALEAEYTRRGGFIRGVKNFRTLFAKNRIPSIFEPEFQDIHFAIIEILYGR
jgi:hypothetical protein